MEHLNDNLRGAREGEHALNEGRNNEAGMGGCRWPTDRSGFRTISRLKLNGLDRSFRSIPFHDVIPSDARTRTLITLWPDDKIVSRLFTRGWTGQRFGGRGDYLEIFDDFGLEKCCWYLIWRMCGVRFVDFSQKFNLFLSIE